MECLDDNVLGAYLAHTLSERERELVDVHLSSCDSCLAITCAAARDQDAPSAERERIGRYVLVEMIGRGGMGTVYLAYDPQLDRKVALKVVRSMHFDDLDLRARLSREARAMAQVRHPNVVAVHDAGETDDGVFIAMELVEGETLARWLAARPRTWREIIRVFAAAGTGLAAAHAAGIVHRDFKPENVLVDHGGRVAVTDFGLAVLHDRPAVVPVDTISDISLDATHFATHAGTLLGTPRYMSPEQFRGAATDSSTDQFSFAVALYHALYGAAPFEGTTVEELARAVTSGNLRARPSGTRVPRRLHRVIARALAASSDARFPSMTALLSALDRMSRPRWPIPAIALSGLATAAIAVLVWPHATAIPPPPKPQPVRSAGSPRVAVFVEKFKNRTGDAQLDDTLDVTVAAVLFSSTQIDPFAGAELLPIAQSVQGDAADVDALAEKLAGSGRSMILAHGSIERHGMGFVVSLDAHDRGSTRPRFAASRSAEGLADVLPVTKRLAADMLESLGDPPVPPSALHVLSSSLPAIQAWVDGLHHAIADDQRGAIAGFQRAVELDPAFAEARSALGLSLYNISDRVDAIAELERAFQAADTIPERQRLMLIGDYYGTVGRFSEAIMAYQQLLAKWPGDARTQISLTATALDANSWPLALEAARAAAARNGKFEIVRRNLVIAELGNGLLPEGLADAKDLIATVHEPSAIAFALLSDASMLLGHPADARAAVVKLATVDPDMARRATADLALYEGRLDDALAAVHGSKTPVDQVIVARTLGRRGDRSGELAAARAATAAIVGEVMPDAYFAASLAIDAGGLVGATDRVHAWSGAPESDRRMYGKLLAGDLAYAEHRPADAIAAYEDAGRIVPTWLVHERLARAQLAAGALGDAQRELAWCLDQRGQAAMTSNPSLELLPEIYLELARSKQAAKAPVSELRAAYQVVVDLGTAAQRDPWTDEARRRLTALPR